MGKFRIVLNLNSVNCDLTFYLTLVYPDLNVRQQSENTAPHYSKKTRILRTARLETVHVCSFSGHCQMSLLGGEMGEGVGPQMNKFEQVSRDHHQMSLAGRAPTSDVQGEGTPMMWPIP